MIHNAEDLGPGELDLDGVLLLDFWAPWCSPCKRLGEQIEVIAEKYPDLHVIKINLDESPRLAEVHGIQSVPAVRLLFCGKLFYAANGSVSVRKLERHIAEALLVA